MKYKILVDNSPADLSEKVTKYLNDGWELSGGVTTAAFGVCYYYAQAVTKLVVESEAAK